MNDEEGPASHVRHSIINDEDNAEVLARLLELNAQRVEQERFAGDSAESSGKKRSKKPSKKLSKKTSKKAGKTRPRSNANSCPTATTAN